MESNKKQIYRSNLNLQSQASGSTLPKLFVALVDKYGQIVNSDNESLVRVNIDQSKKGKSKVFIDGETELSVMNGIAVVEDISVLGQPGMDYDLKISSPQVSQKSVNVNIKMKRCDEVDESDEFYGLCSMNVFTNSSRVPVNNEKIIENIKNELEK